MPDSLRDILSNFFTPERVAVLTQVAIFIAIALPVVLILAKWAKAFFTKRFSAQLGMIVGKTLLYGGVLIIFTAVFYELGFSLTPFLGAAGIVGIAVGFASQTSVSNIISGVFLIAEKPFTVGDLIKVGDTMGFVLSVDILSVKIRAFDNRYIRIPNETLIKSEVANLTRFPMRRIDVEVSVAYKEDIKRVKELLFDVALKNPLCLQEPQPIVVVRTYDDSGIGLLFAVWTLKENFLLLNNSIKEEVKERFDKEGIEIPFPHRTLYTGQVTDPFPVRIMAEASEGEKSPG